MIDGKLSCFMENSLFNSIIAGFCGQTKRLLRKASSLHYGFNLDRISLASCHFSLGPNWLTILELAIEANFPLEA